MIAVPNMDWSPIHYEDATAFVTEVRMNETNAPSNDPVWMATPAQNRTPLPMDELCARSRFRDITCRKVKSGRESNRELLYLLTKENDIPALARRGAMTAKAWPARLDSSGGEGLMNASSTR